MQFTCSMPCGKKEQKLNTMHHSRNIQNALQRNFFPLDLKHQPGAFISTVSPFVHFSLIFGNSSYSTLKYRVLRFKKGVLRASVTKNGPISMKKPCRTGYFKTKVRKQVFKLLKGKKENLQNFQ